MDRVPKSPRSRSRSRTIVPEVVPMELHEVLEAAACKVETEEWNREKGSAVEDVLASLAWRP